MTLLAQELPYDPSKVFDNPLVEITQSALGCFQSCEQKYVLRYLMQLAPRGTAIALVVGTAVHKGLETIMMPKNIGKDSAVVLREALAAIDAIFEAELSKDVSLVGNVSEKLNRGQAQAHACVRAWHFHFAAAYPKEFKVLATEDTFRANPEATLFSALVERMAGKLDGHVIDAEGHHALLENKTKSSLTAFDWINGLSLDRQLLWYLYKARASWGIAVDRVYYNVLAKPQHKAAVGFEALTQKMVEAMYAEPDKYLTMPCVLIDERDVDKQYNNWVRIIARMDNLCAEGVTMNTSACSEWGGCPYKTLCQQRADVTDPEAVLDMPETDLFCFKSPHEELDEAE